MKALSTHLSTLLVIFAASAQQTQVIGHRGAMGHAPENTVLSVQKALAIGVDAIISDFPEKILVEKKYPQKQKIILADNCTLGGNRTHTSEETGF